MPPISLSIVTGPSSLPVVADHAAETTNAPLPRSRVNCRSEAAAQKHREPKKRAPDPKLHPDKPANVREWLEGRMSGIYGHEQVKEKFRTLFKVMQLEKHKRSDHTSLNSTQTGHSTGCTEFGHFIGFRADTLAPTPGHCGTRHSESVWRRPQSDTWSSRSVRFRAAKCRVSGFASRNAKCPVSRREMRSVRFRACEIHKSNEPDACAPRMRVLAHARTNQLICSSLVSEMSPGNGAAHGHAVHDGGLAATDRRARAGGGDGHARAGGRC
jgi:hypothetical protein